MVNKIYSNYQISNDFCFAETRNIGNTETQNLGNSETQKLGISETQKLGISETQKLGSWETQGHGNSEARKLRDTEVPSWLETTDIINILLYL